MRTDEPGPVLAGPVIELAIKVHRRLGPGLLESVYEKCLSWELTHAGLVHARQVNLPVHYEDVEIESGYRADMIVENQASLELKSIETLLPVREAQTLTCLRPSARFTNTVTYSGTCSNVRDAKKQGMGAANNANERR
jgi:GxxExxY protein